MANILDHEYVNTTLDKYRISDYQSMAPQEARILICRKLRGKTFAINVNPIVKEDIVSAVGELDNDTYIEAAVVTSGIVIANCYQEAGGYNTGLIHAGQPVVFDTVTGRAVTGINPAWSPEEYVIVGMAMQGVDPGVPGFFRTPILLGYAELPDTIRVGVLQEDLPAGGEAEANFYNLLVGRDPEWSSMGTLIVHATQMPTSTLPEGMKLPTDSPITMGLYTANGDPFWILLGSPICPVEI